MEVCLAISSHRVILGVSGHLVTPGHFGVCLYIPSHRVSTLSGCVWPCRHTGSTHCVSIHLLTPCLHKPRGPFSQQFPAHDEVDGDAIEGLIATCPSARCHFRCVGPSDADPVASRRRGSRHVRLGGGRRWGGGGVQSQLCWQSMASVSTAFQLVRAVLLFPDQWCRQPNLHLEPMTNNSTVSVSLTMWQMGHVEEGPDVLVLSQWCLRSLICTRGRAF